MNHEQQYVGTLNIISELVPVFFFHENALRHRFIFKPAYHMNIEKGKAILCSSYQHVFNFWREGGWIGLSIIINHNKQKKAWSNEVVAKNPFYKMQNKTQTMLCAPHLT